jgi:hypothetical protein
MYGNEFKEMNREERADFLKGVELLENMKKLH